MEQGTNFSLDRLRAYFQPIVGVASGLVVGYEALGRIERNGEVQSLGPFFHDVSIAYKDKLEADRYVREQAISRFVAECRHGFLTLNICPSWILNNNGEEFFTLKLLERYGLDPQRVVIEILEQEYNLDNAEFSRLIQHYRDRGLRIAIDDFSFHNFDRLIDLRPDFVKVDRTLVKQGREREEYRRILGHIAEFAIELGISVLFEGVETQEELDTALDVGANYIQGFFFAEAERLFLEKNRFVVPVEEALLRVADSNLNQRRNFIQIENEMNSILDGLFETKRYNFDDFEVLNFDYFLQELNNELPACFFKSYICDRDGRQLSSNIIRNSDGSLSIYEEYRNMNWIWRPYFVDNLVRMENLNRGVISQKYIDDEKRQETVTFSYPISKDYFLFLDFYYDKRISIN